MRKAFYGNKIKKSFMKEKRKPTCRSDLNKVGRNVIAAIWEWRSCLHRESQVYRLLFINCQTAFTETAVEKFIRIYTAFH